MSFPYEDIVRLPHPISTRHARMSDADRAAQFSPFAALNGHEEAIAETARLTDRRPQLAEDGAAELNETLCALAAQLDEQPEVAVTCFVQDEKKPGGSHRTVTGRMEKLDLCNQRLLVAGTWVPLGDVIAVRKLDAACPTAFHPGHIPEYPRAGSPGPGRWR
ncbi:MAG: hypothetical protein Q4F17_08255 [Eubacteriales bacterium]|nr:hypothetical protein [Eubacteriales bacterium]